MLRKISLSVMTFTYFFAGLYHFTRFDYFLALVPAFMPQPRFIVDLAGSVLFLISCLLPFRATRRSGCYLALLILGINLPVDGFVLIEKGAGVPLPMWVLISRVPFHLVMMAWAWIHLRTGEKKENQKP